MAKKNIPSGASNKKDDGKVEVRLLPHEVSIHGLSDEKDNTLRSHVNLKYYNYAHQCLSQWTSEELSNFSEFTNKLTSMTWEQIYKTGGKSGNKTGVGYTPHSKKNKLPNQGIVSGLSEDISFFELRVNQKARVHGFRSGSSFFLVWLDRNHEVYPE